MSSLSLLFFLWCDTRFPPRGHCHAHTKAPIYPQVEDCDVPQTRAGLLAAAVGGVAGGVLSHPWDVVKTCMQGDLERTKHGSARQVPPSTLKKN
jgi:hypothetical protein